MMITFGDDAADAFRAMVAAIPADWSIALLDDEPLTTGDFAQGIDYAQLVATTPEGIAYRDVAESGEIVAGPIKIRRWEEIARVHVY